MLSERGGTPPLTRTGCVVQAGMLAMTAFELGVSSLYSLPRRPRQHAIHRCTDHLVRTARVLQSLLGPAGVAASPSAGAGSR